MELLEDGHREREAALDLQEGRQGSVKVGWAEKVTMRRQRGVSYQVRNDFLEELGAFFHLVLGSPQLDDVTLLCRVREVNNHLDAEEIMITKITNYWVKKGAGGQEGHLGKLVPNFFYLFALLSNDCAMELLLHNQVFSALVFLLAGWTAAFKQCLFRPQTQMNSEGMFTILWTISMSSLRASWTPLGSPSILTSPLRSES